MVCTTVTIAEAKPVISGVSAVQVTGELSANLSWTQDKSGSVWITVDGVKMAYTTAGNAGSNTVRITGLSVASHSLCVDAA